MTNPSGFAYMRFNLVNAFAKLYQYSTCVKSKTAEQRKMLREDRHVYYLLES